MVLFLFSSRAQNSSSAAVSWKTPTPIRHAIPHVPSVTGVLSIQKKKRRSEKFRSILWCPSSPENWWDSSFLRVDKSALSYQQIATSGQRGGSPQRLETSAAGTCSSEEIYVYSGLVPLTVVEQQPDILAEFLTLSSPIASPNVPLACEFLVLSLLVAFYPLIPTVHSA